MNICWKDKMNPLTRVEKSLVPLGALAFVWERIAQKALWMRIIIRVGFSSFGSLLDLSECSLILAKKASVNTAMKLSCQQHHIRDKNVLAKFRIGAV